MLLLDLPAGAPLVFFGALPVLDLKAGDGVASVIGKCSGLSDLGRLFFTNRMEIENSVRFLNELYCFLEKHTVYHKDYIFY